MSDRGITPFVSQKIKFEVLLISFGLTVIFFHIENG